MFTTTSVVTICHHAVIIVLLTQKSLLGTEIKGDNFREEVTESRRFYSEESLPKCGECVADRRDLKG